VFSVAPFASSSVEKTGGRVIATAPGSEATTLDSLIGAEGDGDLADAARLLREPGAVLLVGERLAQTPGALSAAARLSASTGARLGWVPRRAGERGALDAGALAGVLPGGRPWRRRRRAAPWPRPGASADRIPAESGRDLESVVAAVHADAEAMAAADDPPPWSTRSARCSWPA